MHALFSGKLSVIAATAVVYAAFALLKLVGWLIANREKLKKIEVEVKSWEERRHRAVQARDMRLYERVQREKPRIDRLRREIELEKLKASAASFAAWLASFGLLQSLLGDPPVALTPAPWGYTTIPLSAWFIINSLWANALLERLASILHPPPTLAKKRRTIARRRTERNFINEG